MLHGLSAEVIRLSGTLPLVFVREGRRVAALFAPLEEHPEIAIVILAASGEGRNNDPIIEALTGAQLGKLRAPIVIIPSGMRDAEIDAVV